MTPDPADRAARAADGARLAVAYVRAAGADDPAVSVDLIGAAVERDLVYEFVCGLCALVIGRGGMPNLNQFLNRALAKINADDVNGKYERFFREQL